MKIMNIKKKHITFPFLTYYEKVIVISTRVEQLNNGAPPLIDIKSHKIDKIKDIALLELKYKVIPFKIKRNLPNGFFEIWNIEDLIILDD